MDAKNKKIIAMSSLALGGMALVWYLIYKNKDKQPKLENQANNQNKAIENKKEDLYDYDAAEKTSMIENVDQPIHTAISLLEFPHIEQDILTKDDTKFIKSLVLPLEQIVQNDITNFDSYYEDTLSAFNTEMFICLDPIPLQYALAFVCLISHNVPIGTPKENILEYYADLDYVLVTLENEAKTLIAEQYEISVDLATTLNIPIDEKTKIATLKLPMPPEKYEELYTYTFEFGDYKESLDPISTPIFLGDSFEFLIANTVYDRRWNRCRIYDSLNHIDIDIKYNHYQAQKTLASIRQNKKLIVDNEQVIQANIKVKAPSSVNKPYQDAILELKTKTLKLIQEFYNYQNKALNEMLAFKLANLGRTYNPTNDEINTLACVLAVESQNVENYNTQYKDAFGGRVAVEFDIIREQIAMLWCIVERFRATSNLNDYPTTKLTINTLCESYLGLPYNPICKKDEKPPIVNNKRGLTDIEWERSKKLRYLVYLFFEGFFNNETFGATNWIHLAPYLNSVPNYFRKNNRASHVNPHYINNALFVRVLDGKYDRLEIDASGECTFDYEI